MTENKLFEINKKIREFKFLQNLQIEFTKNDKVLKKNILANTRLHSEIIESNDIKIDELIDIKHNQLSSRVEWWTDAVLCCIMKSIVQPDPYQVGKLIS